MKKASSWTSLTQGPIGGPRRMIEGFRTFAAATPPPPNVSESDQLTASGLRATFSLAGLRAWYFDHHYISKRLGTFKLFTNLTMAVLG